MRLLTKPYQTVPGPPLPESIAVNNPGNGSLSIPDPWRPDFGLLAHATCLGDLQMGGERPKRLSGEDEYPAFGLRMVSGVAYATGEKRQLCPEMEK